MTIDTFIHRKPYENYIKIVRRDLVTFLPSVLLFLTLFFLPFVIYKFIGSMFPDYLSGPVSYPLFTLFGSIYCLSILLFFYTYFVEFYLDIAIMTNDRLLTIKQSSLFARTISELDLYQIQDATSEVNGFFHTVFNYGDLIIQTAGTVTKFVMEDVPNPDELREKILALSADDKKFHNKQ